MSKTEVRPRDKGGGVVGVAVLALLAVVPVVAFVRVQFDGAGRVLEAGGAEVYRFQGTSGDAINQVVYLACILVFGYFWLTGQRSHVLSPSFTAGVAAFGMWMAFAAYHRQEGLYPVLTALSATAGLVAISRVTSGPKMFQRLGWLALVVAAAQFAYALAGSSGAAVCRPDKCSVVGELWTSFYPNENTFGLLCALLVPLIAFLPQFTARSVGLLLLVFSVIGSGSRTSYLVVSVAVISFIAIRKRLRNGDSLAEPIGPRISRLVPLAGFAASTWVVFNVAPDAFTGRGVVYTLVRESLARHKIFGAGRAQFEDAYDRGVTPEFLFVHEHSFVGYLLNNGGYVAFLSVLAVVVLLVYRGCPFLALVLAAPVIAAWPTEMTWVMDIRSPFFWSLLVVFLSLTFDDKTIDASDESPNLAASAR